MGINCNYAARRHRDNSNEGPSAIKAIGKFSVGQLDYFPKDTKAPNRCEVTALDANQSVCFDVSKKFVLFNGNNAHGVRKFKGNRYSLVFFTTAKFRKIKKKEVDILKKLGFKIPTMREMNIVKAVSNKLDKTRAKILK